MMDPRIERAMAALHGGMREVERAVAEVEAVQRGAEAGGGDWASATVALALLRNREGFLRYGAARKAADAGAELRAGERALGEAVALLGDARARAGGAATRAASDLGADLDHATADALSELALFQSERGDDAAALASLRGAVGAWPDSPKMRCNLAFALFSSEEESGMRRDRARCEAILDQLEAAARSGPYPTTIKVAQAVRRLPQLPPDLGRRAQALEARLAESPSRADAGGGGGGDRADAVGEGIRGQVVAYAARNPRFAGRLRRVQIAGRALAAGAPVRGHPSDPEAMASEIRALAAEVASKHGLDATLVAVWLAEHIDEVRPSFAGGCLRLLLLVVLVAALWAWLGPKAQCAPSQPAGPPAPVTTPAD